MSAAGASAGAAAGSATGNGDSAGDAAHNGYGNGDAFAGEQHGPDLAALAQQLAEVADGQEDLRRFLSGHPALAQQDPGFDGGGGGDDAGEFDAFDFGYDYRGDEGYDGDPGNLAEQISDTFETAVGAALQEHVGPIAAQLSETQGQLGEMQQESHLRDLLTEFPEMGDPEVHRDVIKTSQDFAQLLGVPEKGSDPRLWRIIFAAGRAFDAAKNEGADTPAAAHLEGGGGATPGGQSSAADQIINGRTKPGASVLPFS